MKIATLLAGGRPALSYEFSPPKDEPGTRSLFETLHALKRTQPAFVSVTYGAGGSTRDRTAAIVARIVREEGVEAMPHLTCVGSTEREIGALCETLARSGVENVLALRGDPPRGQTAFRETAGGFRYAKELVRFLRENFDFCLGAACYPERHPETDDERAAFAHLRDKVDAGVDFLITQMFYRSSDFERFVARARENGISVPILAGIFPPTELLPLLRMTTKCGASVPPELVDGLTQASAEVAVRFGVASSAALCRDALAGGAAGLHFYTRNRAPDALSVLDALGPAWRREPAHVRTWTAHGANLRARTV